MPIPQAAIPLSVHTITIPEHILADLDGLGISSLRVKKKVLALAANPNLWKAVEKWALSSKSWESRHTKHVKVRTCYKSLPTNRLTLHPVVKRLAARYFESVLVEMFVEFTVQDRALYAHVHWYTETSAHEKNVIKPR